VEGVGASSHVAEAPNFWWKSHTTATIQCKENFDHGNANHCKSRGASGGNSIKQKGV